MGIEMCPSADGAHHSVKQPVTHRVDCPIAPPEERYTDSMSAKIHTATTQEELQKIAAEAKGPVVLEFVADWCDACHEEQPKVAKLTERCPSATVVQVDVDKAPELADAWGVEAMPTLYVAGNAAELQPGKAREVANAREAAKVLKCKR